jgi:hypothetical protein
MSPTDENPCVAVANESAALDNRYRARIAESLTAKEKFRAGILNPDRDVFRPRAELGARSAIEMACYAANGEDHSDGDFIYGIAESIADLRVLVARVDPQTIDENHAALLCFARSYVAAADKDDWNPRSPTEQSIDIAAHYRARMRTARTKKAEFRAMIVNPSFDIFLPRPELGARSAMDLACYAANADDRTDNSFAYEVEDGVDDLRVLIARVTKEPTDEDDVKILTIGRALVAAYDEIAGEQSHNLT